MFQKEVWKINKKKKYENDKIIITLSESMFLKAKWELYIYLKEYDKRKNN